jgi:NhaA family Na+:H+ antiporter
MRPLHELRAPHWSVTPLARLITPMQRFLHHETSGGVILLAMTVLALFLANSPFATSYFHILETEVGISIGSFHFEHSVLHWINDGLMVIFFFMVGLEIKREILVGELASVRLAALPIIAAIGGVLVPALIYMLFNAGGHYAHGWAIPTATDIAFAIGCLALLGKRVPFSLKVFLTAVAIVDDLIAVLVIAFFYSSGLDFTMLGIGFIFLGILVLANFFGIRTPLVYAGVGVLVWLAFLNSGVHATIAGVLIACTVPARYRIDEPSFLERAKGLLAHFEQGHPDSSPMLTDERQQVAVLELEKLCEDVQAPLQKMEHSIHGWVSWLIMPIFALANAGVHISFDAITTERLPIMLGVVCGLVIGKPIGLFGASWLAIKLGIAAKPAGVTWLQMFAVTILGGIGFTMALFVGSLSFDEVAALDIAKISILIASLLAAVGGMIMLNIVKPSPEAEAEPTS